MYLPDSSNALLLQAAVHIPQDTQDVRSTLMPSFPAVRALRGQVLMHSRQPMHLAFQYKSCGEKECDSGFAHQAHRSGQPFRNTSVRMPGPSFTEKRSISNTTPEVLSYSDLLKFMLRPFDDIILGFAFKVIEQCAVAGYADYKILKVIRVLLRLF